MSRLIVMNKTTTAKQINLRAHGATTLGRAEQCDVVLDSQRVSRVHAEIVRRGEQLVLRDLGSSNGTFVNGRRVLEQVLQHNDMVTLGDCQVRFLSPAASLHDKLALVDWAPAGATATKARQAANADLARACA